MILGAKFHAVPLVSFCFLFIGGRVTRAQQACTPLIDDLPDVSGDAMLQTHQARNIADSDISSSPARDVFPFDARLAPRLKQQTRGENLAIAQSSTQVNVTLTQVDKGGNFSQLSTQVITGDQSVTGIGMTASLDAEGYQSVTHSTKLGIGKAASLDAKGYRSVRENCRRGEVETFTRRLVASHGLQLCREEQLSGLLPLDPCTHPGYSFIDLNNNILTHSEFLSDCEGRHKPLQFLEGDGMSNSAANTSTYVAEDSATSTYDRKDITTLFYHFHIPKTGGTTVANLIMADICSPFSANFSSVDWNFLCSQPCEMGLTDNMLSCYPERYDFEHGAYNAGHNRSQSLLSSTGANRIVYVTSLRRGSDRLLSQWAHEVLAGAWSPPIDVEKISNKSLQLYISGVEHEGDGWIQNCCPQQRNNLQVAELASMPCTCSAETDTQVMTRAHLEEAKQALLSDEWLIGFTDCMPKLHEALTRDGEALHGFPHYNRGAIVPVTESRTPLITLDEETKYLLDSFASWDNELYEWAWTLAEQNMDPRFVGVC